MNDDNNKKSNQDQPLAGQVVDQPDLPAKNKFRRKVGNIYIGTLNVFTGPVKKELKDRYDKFYHPALPHRKKHIVLDIVIGLIIMALIALVSYWFYFSDFNRYIKLEIRVPDIIESGDQINYVFYYENTSDRSLLGVSLAVNPPAEFKFVKSAPQDIEFNQHNNTFMLGDLAAGANGYVHLVGATWGDVNQSQTIKARFGYELIEEDGRKIEDSKLVSYHYYFDNSVYDLSFDLPEQILNNQEINFSVDYKNFSDNFSLPVMLIKPYWPKGFYLLESDVQFDQNDQGFYIYDLQPRQSGHINIKGYLSGLSEANKNFEAEAYALVDDKKLLQAVYDVQKEITYPKFLINFQVEPATVSLGDNIGFCLEYKNNEDYQLNNLQFTVDLNSQVFNVYAARGRNFDVSGTSLIFSYKNMESLKILPSGSSGRFEFNVRTKNTATAVSYLKKNNSRLLVDVKAEYLPEGNIQSNPVTLRSNSAVVKFNTSLRLNSAVRYWSIEGDQLGRGPLPPQVGSSTRYWLFMTVSNQLNSLSNAKAIINLAKNVDYQGRSSVSAGYNIRHNLEQRALYWDIGILPVDKQKATAAIELVFSPKAGQAGQSAGLVDSIVLTGVDQLTGRPISQSAGALTTDLKTDSYAIGKSIVE